MSSNTQNMMSNALRGEYMRDMLDKTIQEIHDDMVTVFGPYAQDAFITKDKQPYYTRDGKEVVSSLTFNNELAMYVLKIIYQAVHNQARTVGDGTTSVAVFYTNLYRIIREEILQRNEDTVSVYDTLMISNTVWNKACKKVIEKIKEHKVPMTKELLGSLLLTCTQDEDLSMKIYKNLADAIMEQAYIIINKANIEDDFRMTVYQKPLIKATRQFSVYPVKPTENLCTILYCNGMLDLGHPDLLLDVMSNMVIAGEEYLPKTIVILCHGMTDRTRIAVKSLVQEIQKLLDAKLLDTNTFSNLAIYTLDEYRSYDTNQIEDIIGLLTDEDGATGLVNQLTFESLLYQAFHNPNGTPIPDLDTFDCDSRHITKMRELMAQAYSIEFDELKGMKINKELGPVAQARYVALRDEIQNEKSEVKQVALRRRLRTIYGKFIEVEVGSKLLKDSQHKFELILDAVLSGSDAAEHGILVNNGILTAITVLRKMIVSEENEAEISVYWLLFDALRDTFIDMITPSNTGSELTEEDREEIRDQLFRLDLETAKKFYIDPNSYTYYPVVDEYFKNDGSEKITLGDTEVPKQVVEPVNVITTMIENTSVVRDLAFAKTFHLDGFVGNYI